jgi:hypothetical protein
MAKRFIDTELINEDWYLDLPSEIKLFWIYALCKCDHAGFLKANLRAFNALHSTAIDADTILKEINAEKERIRVIDERLWWITDFCKFQYGENLNPNNRAHLSVLKRLSQHSVSYGSNMGHDRGMDGVKEKEKEKEKDIEKDISNTVTHARELPMVEDIHREMQRWCTNAGMDVSQHPANLLELAEKFLNHYDAQGWKRSNGMLIYKWQPLISTWMGKEKSRTFNSNKTTERKWKK